MSSFAGFRGAISLAIALSVPATMDTGEPLAGRHDIVFVTAGVIVITLLVQGPLLPRVVRWARLPEDTAIDDELRHAEHTITAAGLAALPDLAAAHRVSDGVLQRLTRDYEDHLRLVEAESNLPAAPAEPAELQGASLDTDVSAASAHRDSDSSAAPQGSAATDYEPVTQHEEYTRLRLASLAQKREVLVRLRHQGSIDDSVARQIQTRLDIEELRLAGVNTLE